MTPEQRRIFNSKPIERMRRFVRFLHWSGLQLERILFTTDEIAKWNVAPSGIIAYYMTTDAKFNLQINELDIAQPFTHQGTVKAERYGIRDVGWHPFTLFEDVERMKLEAERLRPWLDRKSYKNRQWIRKVKREHPEMSLPSRKRPRGGKSAPWLPRLSGDVT